MLAASHIFKPGAISKWIDIIDYSDRLHLAIKDVNEFSNKYDILPRPCNVFNMFRMIYPCDVKVVIVAQSPYPDSCPCTKIEYAFGPAFLPSPGCVTTPLILKNIILEASRDMCKKSDKLPNEIVMDWIEQGVMMLNASLTIGKNCPEYLEDHSIVWEEIMIRILNKISALYDPVFLLVGTKAWKFENSIDAKIIKILDPSPSLQKHNPWMGSGVFSKISNILIEKEVMPIIWIK